MRNTIFRIWHMPRHVAIALINVYRATLSPDHGPLKALHPYGFCRHHPTCSAYGKQTIAQRGLIIGSASLFKRLLSCHPWKEPGPERIVELSSRRP